MASIWRLRAWDKRLFMMRGMWHDWHLLRYDRSAMMRVAFRTVPVVS